MDFLNQLLQYFSDITVNAHEPVCDFLRAVCFALFEAGIESLRIFCRLLPEGVLDDDWCIASNAQFQIQNMQSSCSGFIHASAHTACSLTSISQVGLLSTGKSLPAVSVTAGPGVPAQK